jgi:hypothetical protein
MPSESGERGVGPCRPCITETFYSLFPGLYVVSACTLHCPRNCTVKSNGPMSTWAAVLPVAPRRCLRVGVGALRLAHVRPILPSAEGRTPLDNPIDRASEL